MTRNTHPADHPEYSRLLIVGDTHGNTGYMKAVYEAARTEDVDAIIQLGDFGYWPRHPFGQTFIRKTSNYAQTTGIPTWFCDGNHEDHERLPHRSEHPVEVAPGVIHASRGQVTEFGGRRLLFFGGAVSVDQAWRHPGYDWFSEEVPRLDEWERAHKAGKVDVVVAHDVPEGVALRLEMKLNDQLEEACAQMRRGLLGLAETVEPRLWLAGHYHQRTSTQLGAMRVEVFDCEHPLETSVAILELADLTIRELPKRILTN